MTTNDQVQAAADVAQAEAYADGYKAALDDCERADVAELLTKIDGLEGRLSFEKAKCSIAERRYDHQCGRIVELEKIAASRATPADPALDPATVEACAKVADRYDGVNLPPPHSHASIIAAAIRALASGEDRK